ncbi:MAG TPA: UDP-4-amino-4,6-dideoxy-N-acetyl-beta-L-altrosamine transaminase [Ruminococcaceae bacterium]|nr:UDP-4-amino-4,6-dideoxy-N-acetyl-beta-L-altrosamine transaminase [Oscillospiraceae bacterium]HBG55984.1 UDP-4-amino-4,6-dideoxy-N-acetyl-beta-L-altrosamine transaminase [Oscillospiraceae bacterium]HBQ45703.1 UDP-4-amino-4,6-dideoxy-N-acetyl-beta-L-altrosamine transaminase [Oscillospiraceae bacterium]HBT90763.1 UDP-4-amino-4,6-dideoxy-N-acetyl-beta-L-altrosamine transaminase [Oscillospiraceae bacterium]HCB90837.1 UDP-4-amino-4,6-dideoxy-N-acetyl-beta-L-altrosamine transaminase [Oscillospirace
MSQFRKREDFIPYNRPDLTEREVAAVAETLRSGWIAKGPRTVEFEKKFAEYVGARHAVAMNSCTAALHVALLAKGIGPGDEVITTPMTFASTASTILHVGAKPVFADIDYKTGCIDPGEIEKKITPRTKAVVPVHYSGQVCDLDRIYAIAEKYGLYVSEDAAHALASRYKGRLIGNRLQGSASYSFYATKNLTTGEGGMLATDDDEIDAKARIWAGQGMSHNAWNRYAKGGAWRYDICEPGFKYNMFDIQAALGLVQLSRMGEMQARRLKIAEKYQREFAKIDAVEPPFVPDYATHSWHLYVLRIVPELLTIDRDRFITELNSRNVGTSVHFIPVTDMSAYTSRFGFKPGDFPNTEKHFQRIISLPLYPTLTDEQADYVVDAVRDIVEKYHR